MGPSYFFNHIGGSRKNGRRTTVLEALRADRGRASVHLVRPDCVRGFSSAFIVLVFVSLLASMFWLRDLLGKRGCEGRGLRGFLHMKECQPTPTSSRPAVSEFFFILILQLFQKLDHRLLIVVAQTSPALDDLACLTAIRAVKRRTNVTGCLGHVADRIARGKRTPTPRLRGLVGRIERRWQVVQLDGGANSVVEALYHQRIIDGVTV